MRSRVLFALLLTFIAAAAFAAPTTIRGKVVTADGSTPYPDVEITVVANGQTVYTDSEGEFFVRNLQPGDYEITVKTSRSSTKHRITALAAPVTEVKLAVK